MAKPLTIEIDFILITPAFLGDANQKAQLRPQSFKGMLRFWYRAIDAGLITDQGKRREDELWGGAGSNFGQSRVLLRVKENKKKNPPPWVWHKDAYNRFTDRKGKNYRNGMHYLGYPFSLPGNEKRTALAPGTLFTLQAVIPQHSLVQEEWQQKAILGSLWFFSVLGACGTRSRRGFGSLQPYAWRLSEENENKSWQDAFNAFPNPATMNAPDSWQEAIRKALSWLQGADRNSDFLSFPDNVVHPHLDPDFSPKLLEGFGTWEDALNHAGRKMQDFRQCLQPDKSMVLNLLEKPVHQQPAPGRITFGLPLKFQFRSRKDLGTVTFHPQNLHATAKASDRFSSSLYLKIIRLKMRYYPCFFRLNGARPGKDVPVSATIEINRKKVHHLYMADPGQNSLEQFLESLRGI